MTATTEEGRISMRNTQKSLGTAFGILGMAIASIASAQNGTGGGDWRSYAGDMGSTKYSPLSQINADNFKDLEVVWEWESIDSDVTREMQDEAGVRARPQDFESTPLMVDGVLYTSTSLSQVAAIDAGTGETIWKYDPGSWKLGRPANIGFIHRGVSYWEDGDDKRVYIATGHSKLIALNAKTGELISEFGENGVVDLFLGLNKPARVGTHQVNSPPIITNDVIVTGCVIMDRPITKEFLRGDVRAYDVRTGKKLWTFHSIPQEGEFGQDTWKDGSWKYTGNTNVWSLISADDELGYVYLPFGAPSNDFYGGHRIGDNLYANSIVCIDVKTGKRVWHFQTVHHDLWDYDLPCAPNLADVMIDGKPRKIVAQLGKTGFCYVFDRVTGEPIWPIEEVAVPASNIPGEVASPTQPMPTKPPAFSAQGLSEDTLIDFTPELKKDAREFALEYGFTPLFTPGSEKGVLMIPGEGGGANWSGGALDPDSSVLYVPAMSYARLLKLGKPDPARSNFDYIIIPGHMGGTNGPNNLPVMKAPYSSITAINLKDGTFDWQVPIGDVSQIRPPLKDLDIPPTGDGGMSFPLATKTLLVLTHGSRLFALDKASGKTIEEMELREKTPGEFGRIHAAPMTYMHEGKQHIVVALTGGNGGGRLVALALP